jgi:hypothetical protein
LEIAAMNVSGSVSSLGAASGQSAQASQSSSPQRRHGAHAPSMSDVDAQSSSLASSNRSTGRVGSKVDITA